MDKTTIKIHYNSWYYNTLYCVPDFAMSFKVINLVTGRQLRAARVLAGLTQKTLGAALGVDQRAVRFWERKHDRRPTNLRNAFRIEKCLIEHGVVIFSEPTPGARLAEKR